MCLGLPGALPVLTAHAVTLALRAALATHCTVQETSVFARKNYFYPDLPKGYQISQYERPLATEGYVEIPVARRPAARAPAPHPHGGGRGQAPARGLPVVQRDERRRLTTAAACRSIEIVSHPDMHSSEEAYEYLTALRAVLLYAEVSDGNMEEGSLRCDANVSVRRRGSEALGTRAEIKNLNSFRNVARAIDHEVARQAAMLEAGRPRRPGDAPLGRRPRRDGSRCAPRRRRTTTATSRSPTCRRWSSPRSGLAEVRRSMPELPAEKQRRFVAEYGLPDLRRRRCSR